MHTKSRWLASMVIPLLLQVAACSGGSGDSGDNAPQGGGLRPAFRLTHVEAQVKEAQP